MRATYWEFRNRALLIGLIFGAGFSAYNLDPQNSAAAAANWLGSRLGVNPDIIARILFALAALLLFLFALVRTWASAYLHARVVYAPEVKSDALVTDGPYRHVRNPLYFANLPLVLGLAAFMSRIGFFFAIAAMVLFTYRLILREEAELAASLGERFEEYRRAVPRLWPSIRPRIPSSGSRPNWRAGLLAEAWAWGNASAAAIFAVSLNIRLFLIILAVSIGVLALAPAAWRRKTPDPRSNS
jgi:protein-S-isoprenylcysteine O-methyltransferase Ste14